mgnify:CR=1 FL=1
MKFLILMMSLLLSSSVFASLSQEDVQKAIAGQWSVNFEGVRVKFLIRSSGDISVISSDHYTYLTADLGFSGSNADWRINGLPVAHIILAEGSDEDVRDVHFLITAIGEGDDIQLKKLAAFSTFNDGPNEFSDAESGWSALKKYDAKSKKWIEIK